MHTTRRLGGTATAVAVSALVLLLTACAQSSPDSSPRPSASRSAQADLLTVVRGGGLAGGTTTVTVRTEGSWRTERATGPTGEPRSGQLDSRQVSELRELLASERYAALPARTFEQPSPDAYTYTFRTPDDGRTVTADDTSLREPLGEILRLLRPAFAGR